VIALSRIKLFARKPGVEDAREPLLALYGQVSHADWARPADVKRDIRSVSILRDGRAVFNIAGNKYRSLSGSTIRTAPSISDSSERTANTTPSTHKRFESRP
jgi:mRNA-degrading endonuclease HigB of HigAB toxin-antitoxin module